MPENSSFTAIVLAGDRGPDDPVARSCGVSSKAIIDIDGKPMITRVLDALIASRFVDKIIICGPPANALDECPQLQAYLGRKDLQRIDNLDSPSLSAESALSTIPLNEPVFLTTADHALLETELVDYFLERSLSSSADVNVGLVNYDTILASYPEVKRTVIKFSDAGVCGCNLFSFINERGRRIASFWRSVEKERKRPWRLILGLLGPLGVIKYAVRMLKLQEALARISSGLEIRVDAVVMPYPQAGVDVDTVKDLDFVETLLQKSR